MQQKNSKIQFFGILIFLLIVISGCSYKSNASLDSINISNTKNNNFDIGVFYDPELVNLTGIFKTSTGGADYEINFVDFLNESSRRVLKNNFQNIDNENSRLVAVTDSKINYKGNNGWGEVYLDGYLSLTFKDRINGKTLKKYEISEDITFTSGGNVAAGILTGLSLFLLAPITIPMGIQSAGNDARDASINFYNDSFNKIHLKIKSDESLFRSYVSKDLDDQEEFKTISSDKTLECGVAPLSAIGDVSEVQQQFINNKIQEIISKDFKIVPQKRFEEAMDIAFDELNYDECTEDQCFAKIQDILQVENIFSFQVLKDEKLYQLTLKLNTLDEKFIATELCENCSTSDILSKIEMLFNKMKKDFKY